MDTSSFSTISGCGHPSPSDSSRKGPHLLAIGMSEEVKSVALTECRRGRRRAESAAVGSDPDAGMPLACSLIATDTMDGSFARRFAGRLERAKLAIGNSATTSIEVHINSFCNAHARWLASGTTTGTSTAPLPRTKLLLLTSLMPLQSSAYVLCLTALSMPHQP